MKHSVCTFEQLVVANVILSFLVLKEKFRIEPEDIGVVKGATAKLTCSPPKGTPSPTVFWEKDGKVIDIEQDER